MKTIKRRDGFNGEKMINLPESVWKKVISDNTVLGQLYVTHIGYFPKTTYHYREWKKGCPDNILIYCLRGKGWYELGKKRFEVGVNEFISFAFLQSFSQSNRHVAPGLFYSSEVTKSLSAVIQYRNKSKRSGRDHWL